MCRDNDNAQYIREIPFCNGCTHSFLHFLFVEVKFVKIDSTLFRMVLVRFLANDEELTAGPYGRCAYEMKDRSE